MQARDEDVQLEDQQSEGLQDRQVDVIEQAWNNAMPDEPSPPAEDAFQDPLATDGEGGDALEAMVENVLQDDTASEGSHPSSDMSLESPGSEG